MSRSCSRVSSARSFHTRFSPCHADTKERSSARCREVKDDSSKLVVRDKITDEENEEALEGREKQDDDDAGVIGLVAAAVVEEEEEDDDEAAEVDDDDEEEEEAEVQGEAGVSSESR